MGNVLTFKSRTPVIYISGSARSGAGPYVVEVRPCPAGIKRRFETGSSEKAYNFAAHLRDTYRWRLDRSDLDVGFAIDSRLDSMPWPDSEDGPHGGEAA